MDSKTYDELHGSNNWDGLLDPLHLHLRTLILGYGDLSSAAARALNNDDGSKYNGYSRYGKSSFFQGVMLPWAESKYKVASFIYATASVTSKLPFLLRAVVSGGDSQFESSWMGYVAVSNDEFSKSIGCREICVVWRGIVKTYEWKDGILGAMPVSAEPLLPPDSIGARGEDATDNPKVVGGWLTIYNTSDPDSEFAKASARTQLLAQIKELLIKYKDEKVSITCTGHSLGACLATLSSFDLAANVATPDINVSAFVFASPQVGNQAFKAKMEEIPNLKVLRIKNDPDIIPFWPSKILKQIDEKNSMTLVPSGLLEYVDIGVEILIDSKKSPYLNYDVKSGFEGLIQTRVYHDLQGMLHTLAGWNGENGEFDWSLVKRGLGWVNMSTGVLKEEYQIPVSWWAVKNKGMVLNDDWGDWVLSPLDPDDHDLPPTTTVI